MPQQRTDEIAKLYDNKKDDLNLILSNPDRLVHHHNGIQHEDAFLLKSLTPVEILRVLHDQETDLTRLGITYLNDKVNNSSIGLDAGAGRGGSAIMLNEQFGCTIVGINLSSYQVNFATDLVEEMGLKDKISFEIGDMCDTRFENEFFDFIWACESTEHIDDLPRMFKEFHRITKPDSPLLIITWTKGEAVLGEEIVEKVNHAYITNIHSISEYEEAALNNGWVIENKVDLTQQTAAYWRLRERSTVQSGTESFMSQGFNNRTLEYYLLKFVRSS